MIQVKRALENQGARRVFYNITHKTELSSMNNLVYVKQVVHSWGEISWERRAAKQAQQ